MVGVVLLFIGLGAGCAFAAFRMADRQHCAFLGIAAGFFLTFAFCFAMELLGADS